MPEGIEGLSFNVPKPPYPFPSQWSRVTAVQVQIGTSKWLAAYPAPAYLEQEKSQHNEHKLEMNTGQNDNIIRDYITKEEYKMNKEVNEEMPTFELNEEWLARLQRGEDTYRKKRLRRGKK
jgi:hypothetical protein